MKLIAVTSLGLVAARPQGANFGNGVMGGAQGANVLSGDLGAFDYLGPHGLGNLDALNELDANAPEISVNNSQLEDVVDAVADAVDDASESKRPMPALVPDDEKHADAKNKNIKKVYEKYSNAFDKNQEWKAKTAAKIQAAKDKHVQQFEADTEAKKQKAQEKAAEFADQAKEVKAKIEAKAQEKKAFAQYKLQKFNEKHQDKVDDHSAKLQKAQDQKEAVEDKHAIKVFNAAEAEKKKKHTLALKQNKQNANKKAHYHNTVAECWNQLKHKNPTLLVEETTFNEALFADLPECAKNLTGFTHWDKVFDWLTEPGQFKPIVKKCWNHLKKENNSLLPDETNFDKQTFAAFKFCAKELHDFQDWDLVAQWLME